ncbi:hypothetical protein OG884_18750 [Streptosporangium sp. NBC_01755]|uniref:hypothetical protein n=1 Tax=Streptosporangium sp. NBC_01755 TaxID=2975949 RepID=UPI002DD9D4D1|nr:hypothetical protein [Streptosporangium sp. NBC_01755]WSD01448.1 hypothetical protein OG884_05845 [Streptosporangium sp. NBC_01755]WSD03848.1 hypothetical protein OG884_18750 [Streptosporangium sp. NBC_01755]
MSAELIGVIIGGVLATIGGLLGQMYAARAQARLRRREAAVAACEELIVVFSRMRSAHNLDTMMNPHERQDRRSFMVREQEEGELNDEISRLAVRVTDRGLRRAIMQFVGTRGRLEGLPNYSELLELLVERCGCVVRADLRRSTMGPLRRAIAQQSTKNQIPGDQQS